MHKIKATKKEMRDNYFIIGIGYCQAQYLLRYQNAVAYSARTEGWACDYYDIDNVIISTGYSPLKSKNVVCNYELIKKYEAKASKIENDYSIDFKARKQRVNKLLKKFIAESKNNI